MSGLCCWSPAAEPLVPCVPELLEDAGPGAAPVEVLVSDGELVAVELLGEKLGLLDPLGLVVGERLVVGLGLALAVVRELELGADRLTVADGPLDPDGLGELAGSGA
ncbi:MAG: hypothetical protein M3Y89_18260 [Actinomycetota bacterium]|nr:hypothetical protein [Actinomycetota bacterium]